MAGAPCHSETRRGAAFEGITAAYSAKVIVFSIVAFHDSCGLGEGLRIKSVGQLVYQELDL